MTTPGALEHSHEHDHEVVNPTGRPVHGDLRHTHSHVAKMNVHHGLWDEPSQLEQSEDVLLT